jgi:peptidyl-tRNA hydrolase
MKLYIAVRDDAPDYMVPTLVAHSMLSAHLKFQDKGTYIDWLHNSFRKVVLRVNWREFDKIRETLDCHEGHEKTICDGESSCLVVMPVDCNNVPNVLKFAKMWKPRVEESV